MKGGGFVVKLKRSIDAQIEEEAETWGSKRIAKEKVSNIDKFEFTTTLMQVCPKGYVYRGQRSDLIRPLGTFSWSFEIEVGYKGINFKRNKEGNVVSSSWSPSFRGP